MSLPSPATKALLACLVTFAVTSGPAVAVQSNGAASQVRITNVTDSSHPFETLHCARQPIQVRYIGQLAEVVIDRERRLLKQAMSASGARYVALGDDTTVLWGKGPFATVTWSGQQLPLCAPSGAIIPPYRASGNEPFWAVTYDGWQATLKRPGEPHVEGDAEIAETTSKGQTLASSDGAQAWRLEATDGLCIDSMSGMPRPQQTTLHYHSDSMHGCGGNPERLLQGVMWRIAPSGEQPANGTTAAHIRFLADNKVVGSTGCNRFFGDYALTGESLSFTSVGRTRMACSSELMAQEEALLETLASVNRFSFKESDMQQLLLHVDSADTEIEAHAM